MSCVFKVVSLRRVSPQNRVWTSSILHTHHLPCHSCVLRFVLPNILLSSLLSSSSSSSPLCRVFILIFLRQTVSVGNTVLQLFCCYYSSCLLLSLLLIVCSKSYWYVSKVINDPRSHKVGNVLTNQSSISLSVTVFAPSSVRVPCVTVTPLPHVC